MPFGKGSRGQGVKALQRVLDSWIKETDGTGLIGVIPDGSFGQNTQVALATYQRHKGLSPSGYADASTLQTLGFPDDMEADSPIEVIDSTGGGV